MNESDLMRALSLLGLAPVMCGLLLAMLHEAFSD